MAVSAPFSSDSSQVEMMLAQFDCLPSLGQSVANLLSFTADSPSSRRSVIEYLRNHPAIAARASAMLGRPNGDLNATILEVGLPSVRAALLATSIAEIFDSGQPVAPSGLNHAEYWRHSLAVAHVADRLNESGIPQFQGVIDPFLLGFLHDVGKIALDTVIPKSYERVLRRVTESHGNLLDAERDVLAIDHTVVGRRLADRWGLPKHFVEAIWLHHQPLIAVPSSASHVLLVQLANAIAREQGFGLTGISSGGPSSSELADSLGIDAAIPKQIAETLADDIKSRSGWIITNHPSNKANLQHSQNQARLELRTANSSLTDENRRLKREVEHSSAIVRLSQSLTPKTTVREACGHAAATIRHALCLESVAVFTISDDYRRVEQAVANVEGTAGEIYQRPANATDIRNDIHESLRSAQHGGWIAPVGPAFADIVDRLRTLLGTGTLYILPILAGGRWEAGALFSIDSESTNAEPAELESLSAVAGMAISQAKARAAAASLAEELAEANRRLAATHAETVRARNLEAVVAMAAGAAHELNNPLAVISGRAQMLRAQATTDDLRTQLDNIVRQSQTASDIVTELMEFAQPRPPSPQAVSLSEILTQLATELTQSGLLGVEQLTIELSSDTPSAWFDVEFARRMFRELLLNAIEATSPELRRLSVKAGRNRSEENLVVQVIDNGRGMTPEALSRATDPFYSWRPAGRGRGLGLSRVARWLADGGGTMLIQSSPGGGTRVEVRLPTGARDGS